MVLSLSSRIGGTTYVDHKFVSIVIGSGVVLLTVLLADRLAGHVAAIVAGSLAAVYPNLWLIDSLLFPEGLFALLTTACILVAYVWWDRPVWWLAVALGALVGLAALTRGEGLLLGPLLAAPWILMRRPLALADRLRQLALAGAACLVVIAPWTIRNLTTFDVFVPLSTNGNELIMYANCDDTYSGRLIGFWSFACQERYRQEIGEPPGDEAEKAQFWRQVGVDYARDHLGDVPRVVAARVLRQWELFRPGQTVEFAAIENRDKPSTAVGLGMYYALLAASIGGAVVLRRPRGPAAAAARPGRQRHDHRRLRLRHGPLPRPGRAGAVRARRRARERARRAGGRRPHTGRPAPPDGHAVAPARGRCWRWRCSRSSPTCPRSCPRRAACRPTPSCRCTSIPGASSATPRGRSTPASSPAGCRTR